MKSKYTHGASVLRLSFTQFSTELSQERMMMFLVWNKNDIMCSLAQA